MKKAGAGHSLFSAVIAAARAQSSNNNQEVIWRVFSLINLIYYIVPVTMWNYMDSKLSLTVRMECIIGQKIRSAIKLYV